MTTRSSGAGRKVPSDRSRSRAPRRRGAVDVEHGELLDAVHAEHPGVLGAVAPALEVPAAVHADDPHRVDVALGGLVAAGHEVAQVHPPVVGDRPAGPGPAARATPPSATSARTRRAGAAAAPAASSSLARARSTASRSPRPGTSRSARSPTTSVTASSTPEPQRAGDGVGVADEHPALLPVGLDQLVGHLAVAAEEEQVEVGLELLDADPEVVGGLLQVDALAVDQPRHHREQPRQPGGGGLLGEPGHQRAPPCATRAPRSRRTTESTSSGGASTTTSAP